MRFQRLALLALVIGLVVPAATASATPQMPIGFFDDISFRYSPNADANLAAAAAAGASVIHTTANWALIAPTKPGDPNEADDPAYRLGDLDALVAGAGRYGIRVMINITGTPKWANGGRTQNYMPTKLSDLAAFTRMLATRYNGKNPGKGSVALWSVWNEPNLQQFLYPQFVGKRIVSVSNYAKLYKTVYAAIKSANPSAKVAIGETSAQGRDKPLKGVSQTVAPGTFARLLSKVSGLRFDAWAHHPYPTTPGAKPLQQVRYPNVNLSTLPTFEKNLKSWFRRPVPLWITEYGHETKPGERKGVTTAQQAAYAKQVLTLVRKDPNVQMFIWFTFRDSPGNPWQSGLETSSGARKPAFNAFASLARLVDGTTTYVKAGRQPTVTMYVPYLSFYSGQGVYVGMTYRVYDGTKLIAVGQPAAQLQPDQSVTFTATFSPAKGKTYRVVADVNNASGQSQTRTATVVAS